LLGQTCQTESTLEDDDCVSFYFVTKKDKKSMIILVKFFSLLFSLVNSFYLGKSMHFLNSNRNKNKFLIKYWKNVYFLLKSMRRLQTKALIILSYKDGFEYGSVK